MKNRKHGFTMIELLIVIVIIGLLASLVAPKMFSKVASSQRDTAMVQMNLFNTALDTYRLDIGSYPDSLDELRQSNNPRWDGPYMPKDIPADPWGNAYVYRKNNDRMNPFYLASLGADGREGGEEDNADVIHQ